MKQYTFPIVIENDSEGYFASCPLLQGCATQGATYEEAMANIEDAIHLHLVDRKAQNEAPVLAGNVSVSFIQCAVE